MILLHEKVCAAPFTYQLQNSIYYFWVRCCTTTETCRVRFSVVSIGVVSRSDELNEIHLKRTQDKAGRQLMLNSPDLWCGVLAS
jgi:hypothetical protein